MKQDVNVRSSSNAFAVLISRDWGREGDPKVRIFSAWLTQLLMGLGPRFFPTLESTNQDSQPSGGKKDSSIEFSWRYEVTASSLLGVRKSISVVTRRVGW